MMKISDYAESAVSDISSSIQPYVKTLISHSIVQIGAHFPPIFFISLDEVILFCTVLVALHRLPQYFSF
jgi:hypothetical protein